MNGSKYKKPNILLIMSDQMRADTLGCNGNIHITTPNFDRLAKNGVNFTNAYTPCPICVPARAGLTTGMYPHKCTGIKSNGGRIIDGMPLLGEELNKRGYMTYAAGKLHYAPYSPPGTPRLTHGIKTVELAESGRILSKFDPKGELFGLEDYLDHLKSVGWGGYSRANGLGNNDVFASASVIPAEYYVDTWVADRTIHNMDTHKQQNPDKPFFIWASFPKPHSAFDPPRPYDSMYDPRDMPSPTGDISLLKERGLMQFYRKHFEYEWDCLSPEAKKTIKAYYYGLVSFQDLQLGRILDHLKKQDILDDTVIIYTADHGEMLGDFGLYFKQTFYNGSVKVPFIISYPSVFPKNKTSSELTGLLDILPTVMSLTGGPLDIKVDGADLTETILNDKPVRDHYVSQCDMSPKQQYMVCSKEWKYIYHEDGGTQELYDLINDPLELNDLSSKSPVTKSMREHLKNWCIENDDSSMIKGNDLIKGPKMEHCRRKVIEKIFGRRYY